MAATITGWCSLNHYALGAMESYLVKSDRGRANREASGFDMGYWVERNFCDVEDRSILALDTAPLRAELARRSGAGPAAPQRAWLAQARFAALMQEEPWRALFGRLADDATLAHPDARARRG